MSIVARDWAWRQKVGPTAKSVLTALADCHNSETGACFPSIDTLAEMTELSRRSVINALEKLESLGTIRRFLRRHPSSHRPINFYELLIVGDNQEAVQDVRCDQDAAVHVVPAAVHLVQPSSASGAAEQCTNKSDTPVTSTTSVFNRNLNRNVNRKRTHEGAHNVSDTSFSEEERRVKTAFLRERALQMQCQREHGVPYKNVKSRLFEEWFPDMVRPSESQESCIEGKAVSVAELSLPEPDHPINGEQVKLAGGVVSNQLNVVHLQGTPASSTGKPRAPRPGEPGYAEWARKHGGFLR